MPRLPRRSARALALAAGLALVAGGCTGDGEPAAQPSASAEAATPLADYETAGLAVTRTSPCPALPERAVTEALGGEVTGGTAYADGEQAALAPGVRAVPQEAGCVFRGEQRAAARAWTFTPPISPGRAKAVARQLRREQGCTPVEDAPAFGDPGLGRTCERGPRVVGSYGGLFGDAWLGCSVAVPKAQARGEQGRRDLVRRTGAWCVQVLESARQATEDGDS